MGTISLSVSCQIRFSLLLVADGGMLLMTDGVVFKRLQVAGWRQFASVEINFHDQLTVLTGANGSGKSTLLNVLSRHIGAERPYLSVPKRDDKGVISYLSGRLSWSSLWEATFGSWKWKVQNQVGEIEYSDGKSSGLQLPNSVGMQYQLEIPNQQSLYGLTIGSHRPIPNYQQIPNIPFQGILPQQAYHAFANEANTRYQGGNSQYSLLYQIKQALAAWAIFGEGNSVIQADVGQREAYTGFVEILRKVLPNDFGFIDLAVHPPDILLVTRSGEFLIDAASGGITTLIEIAALIYGCSIRPEVKNKRFVVVYDEPENHLHPQLQRTLFQNLTKAFPTVQFIVATHSPFIVSSLKDSNVYVLRYKSVSGGAPTEQTRVTSEKLDYTNRAGTASEILREVLGLPTTLPQWVENDLQRIVKKYQTEVIDSAKLEQMKAELRDAGLSELFPEALSGLARNK
jgi:energy-coupling factor transporter ATP-binding protein EcfA2